MNLKLLRTAGCVALLVSASRLNAAELRSLHGHVPAIISQLRATGRPPASRRLDLAIGLTVRNRDVLNKLFQQIYDPSSTNFHRYVTPEQFTEQFGPKVSDLNAAMNFAKTNGLTVIRAYPNRVLFDVSGTVADIEKAFHIALHTYRHPTEDREFIAPDVEPSVDANLNIEDISGLNTYEIPHPLGRPRPDSDASGTSAGSGPKNNYMGNDFRNAYVPGTSLNGAGQRVGLVEFDGYYANDITSYESLASLPNVPLQNILLNSVTGTPSTNANAVGEVSLDIEMVISMAPNLSTLYVFEGTNVTSVITAMAGSNQIKQFSCSWSLAPSNSTCETMFVEMAVQGQSFYDACGDGDAWVGSMAINWPADDTNIISVGGSVLALNGSGVSYISESVWNSGLITNIGPWFGNGKSGYWGSGGGISTSYNIPPWQKLVDTTTPGGSATKRNVPDVAMNANFAWVIFNNNSSNSFFGTSCAAPLWAGYTALVNQQAAIDGRSSVGFINPAIYTIATYPNYSSLFHDVTNGNNFWPSSPSSFSAGPGYDLCTGLGSPSLALIPVLENFSGAVWVDFSAPGPGAGTYANPYNTLALGVANVVSNNTVAIKGPNSSAVTTNITKPLTITASGGAVTIGN